MRRYKCSNRLSNGRGQEMEEHNKRYAPEAPAQFSLSSQFEKNPRQPLGALVAHRLAFHHSMNITFSY